MLLRTHIICFNFDKQPWKQNEICLQATNTACLIHDLSIELQRIRFGDSIPSEVDLLQVLKKLMLELILLVISIHFIMKLGYIMQFLQIMVN